MSEMTAWQAQTRWLSDHRYYSPKRGIWHDRITRRDRLMMVTNSDLRGLRDSSGNRAPRTRAEAAKMLVERAMDALPPAERRAITPAMKWHLVDRMAASHPKEAGHV